MSDANRSLRATLRQAKAEDSERVWAFYLANPNPNVLSRESSVRSACAEERQFLIELETGEILAVSGYYPVGAKQMVELGGTRRADAWPGFGFQHLLLYARLASVALTEGPATEITTAVDPSNELSMRHVLAHGFVSWGCPTAELLVECDPGEGRDGCAKKKSLPVGTPCCSQFYLLPAAALRVELATFLQQTEKAQPWICTHKDGDTITIHIACVAVVNPDYREVLEAIANGK